MADLVIELIFMEWNSIPCNYLERRRVSDCTSAESLYCPYITTFYNGLKVTYHGYLQKYPQQNNPFIKVSMHKSSLININDSLLFARSHNVHYNLSTGHNLHQSKSTDDIFNFETQPQELLKYDAPQHILR